MSRKSKQPSAQFSSLALWEYAPEPEHILPGVEGILYRHVTGRLVSLLGRDTGISEAPLCVQAIVKGKTAKWLNKQTDETLKAIALTKAKQWAIDVARKEQLYHKRFESLEDQIARFV